MNAIFGHRACSIKCASLTFRSRLVTTAQRGQSCGGRPRALPPRPKLPHLPMDLVIGAGAWRCIRNICRWRLEEKHLSFVSIPELCHCCHGLVERWSPWTNSPNGTVVAENRETRKFSLAVAVMARRPCKKRRVWQRPTAPIPCAFGNCRPRLSQLYHCRVGEKHCGGEEVERPWS